MVQLIFDKGAKNTQWGKSSLSNKIAMGKQERHMQNKEMGMLFPLAKINSQWIKDLNVRPEAIKLLEENRESSLTLVMASVSWIWHSKHKKQSKNKDYIKPKAPE